MSFKPHTTEEELHENDGYRSFLGDKPMKDGWRLHMIGKGDIEEKTNGVIYPGYDWELNLEDEAFATSTSNFWTTSADKEYPKEFVPGSWAVPWYYYPFLGESNTHFFSPMNRKKMIGAADFSADELADAFNELWKYVKFGKQFTQKDKDYYTKNVKTATGYEDAPIPNRRTGYFSQGKTFGKKNKEGAKSLLVYSSSAHGYLVEQARWRRDDGDPILDPKLPRYLLGDPTKVDAALVWDVNKLLLDTKDAQETNCLMWTDEREVLRDPLVTRPITKADLASRFNMWDPASWDFPTYQEQVDFMVAEFHKVDLELIREVCGHKADIDTSLRKDSKKKDGPSESAAKEKERSESYDPLAAAVAAASGGRSEPSTPPSEPSKPPGDTVPAEEKVPAAETVPAATETVPVAETVPAVEEPTWAAGEPGGAARRVTAAEILAAKATKLMVNYEGGWKTAAVVAEILFPPKKETAPAAETVPLEETVPTETVPAAETVPTSIDMDALRGTLPPGAYDKLDAAGKAELDGVLVQIEKLRLAGEAVPEALTDRIFALAMG